VRASSISGFVAVKAPLPHVDPALATPARNFGAGGRARSVTTLPSTADISGREATPFGSHDAEAKRRVARYRREVLIPAQRFHAAVMHV